MVASVRHEDTDYDSLLMSGVPREVARERIKTAIERVLASLGLTLAQMARNVRRFWVHRDGASGPSRSRRARSRAARRVGRAIPAACLGGCALLHFATVMYWRSPVAAAIEIWPPDEAPT